MMPLAIMTMIESVKLQKCSRDPAFGKRGLPLDVGMGSLLNLPDLKTGNREGVTK